MNAENLLKKQGWRGAGHSLDTSGRGIKKPLLISHKQDLNGLGHKKAAWKTDDQWWMRAFDESLQSLGTGQTSTLAEVQKKGINRGGLYGFFVKGEGLIGTIGNESDSTVDSEGATTSGEQSSSSTPPTSASASDDDTAPAPTKKTKENKRKRDAKDDAPTQKVKKSRATEKSKRHSIIDAQLAQLTPAKKAEYESRAAEKGQSLEDYIIRRVEKNDAKKAEKAARKAAKKAKK